MEVHKPLCCSQHLKTKLASSGSQPRKQAQPCVWDRHLALIITVEFVADAALIVARHLSSSIISKDFTSGLGGVGCEALRGTDVTPEPIQENLQPPIHSLGCYIPALNAKRPLKSCNTIEAMITKVSSNAWLFDAETFETCQSLSTRSLRRPLRIHMGGIIIWAKTMLYRQT